MLPNCIEVVQAAARAAGRGNLTASQLADLEARMAATQRRLARQDPAGTLLLTEQQRFERAAAQLMQDIQHDADKKLEQAHLQILASARVDAQIVSLQSAIGSKRAGALKAHMVETNALIGQIARAATGWMMDTIKAAGDTRGAGLGRVALMKLFDAENPLMTRDLAREIFANADGHTGNDVAKAGARAWLDAIDKLRVRFNAAGGDVRKLAYGYVPQPHDIARIMKAGRDAWADFTLQKVDRRQYVNEDGTRMSDDQVRDMLKEAYTTITREGQNKRTPGQFQGKGKRANRGADERQIHFADGDAYIDYMSKFGRGPMLDGMLRHVSGIARDIGLVERYGPDSTAQSRLQFDLAADADNTKPGKLVPWNQINPETYWNMISGRTGMPADDGMSRAMQDVRNTMSAAKLGGALWSSIPDLATLFVTTGYNKLGYWQLLKDIGTQFRDRSDIQEFMAAHAMISESLQKEMNRFSGDYIRASWSGHIANATFRLGLLNAWTDGLRQGFKLTMSAGLAKLARTEWGALHEFDRERLKRAGFVESDWQALNSVTPTQFRGRQLLTPDAIGDIHLADRVMAFIHDESEYAVVNPDMRTRAFTTFGGKEAGTAAGEIARTVMQFKSFPIAMLTRHWARFMDTPQGMEGAPMLANRYMYGTALAATVTAMGAISVQIGQILMGQDPIDMTKWRFWAKSAAKGGAWGILGDMLLIDPQNSATDTATTALKNLTGPSIGAVTEMALKLGVENAWQAAEGKDTHAAAEAIQWVKSNTPGASLWWVRPLLEHGVTNQLNEALSPGYLARMKQRAIQNWGARYWWQPNRMEPDRAPNFAAAVP